MCKGHCRSLRWTLQCFLGATKSNLATVGFVSLIFTTFRDRSCSDRRFRGVPKFQRRV